MAFVEAGEAPDAGTGDNTQAQVSSAADNAGSTAASSADAQLTAAGATPETTSGYLASSNYNLTNASETNSGYLASSNR